MSTSLRKTPWTKTLRERSSGWRLAAAELETLIAPLRVGCTADDYKFFMRQIAMAIDGIHTALVDEAVKRFPELEAEMEANVKRTGRVMP